jgi:hypothetical protein
LDREVVDEADQPREPKAVVGTGDAGSELTATAESIEPASSSPGIKVRHRRAGRLTTDERVASAL